MRYAQRAGDTALFVVHGATARHVRNGADLAKWNATGLVENTAAMADDLEPLLPVAALLGPAPFYAADDPTPTADRTRSEDFAVHVA